MIDVLGGGHQPVLVDHVVAAILPVAKTRLVDGTLGLGGHACALLERGPSSLELLGIDRDPQALAQARLALAPFAGRTWFIHGNYRHLAEHLSQVGWPTEGGADAVLLDLGVSSPQLDRPERGFSYRAEGPLDMRMDPTRGETACDLLAHVSESQLVDLLWQYGEERYARRIAQHLVYVRRRSPIRTTEELVRAVIAAVPPAGRGRADHPARRTFQALRMAVNDELGALEEGLEAALKAVRPGGRVVVLAFHSGEDRIVKRAFRKAIQDGTFRAPMRRPTMANAAERQANPRSRSVRLRVVERFEGLAAREGE